MPNPERMITRSNTIIEVQNPCPYSIASFPLSLSLRGVSPHCRDALGWLHIVNNHLSSPALRMGLVADTAHDSTAWFLAAFHHPYTPSITLTIHFGLIRIGPVLLPLFFLRISDEGEGLLLETSLNPYQADLQGLKLLRCLCSQDSYRIHYRSLATKTEHTLDVPNTHHALYRQAVDLLEAHPPWTSTQFVQAQYQLAESWSTPEERYQNLQNPPEHSNSLGM